MLCLLGEYRAQCIITDRIGQTVFLLVWRPHMKSWNKLRSYIDLLSDTSNCGLRMRRECRERSRRERRVIDPDMYHGTRVTHVPWCMPGSITNGFLWSRWRGKRSWHSRRTRKTQFYVSGKRPIGITVQFFIHATGTWVTNKFALKYMLVKMDFLIWILIYFWLCCQPISNQVWKFVLTNIDFDIKISW